MRDLNAEKNVLEIEDPLCGKTHELYYRLPTNDERLQHINGRISRVGKKVKVVKNSLSLSQKYGEKIITGFKKGTIGFDGKVISADPDDPDYRKDWLKCLKKGAPDLLITLGWHVFQGPVVKQGDGVEIEMVTEEEMDRPLES